jgi:uroporphyrinogen-III synthase
MDTVVLTASAGAFFGLAEALKGTSVELVERPLVSFGPPESWDQLDDALRCRSRYGAVALTSPRAATALAQRIRALGLSWNDGESPGIWAVGPATADPLGDIIDAVKQPAATEAKDGAAETLAHAMLSAGVAEPVLFPCGERHREELSRILRSHGIEVDEVVCYRSILAGADQARAALAGADLVIVASPAVLQLLAESSSSATRPPLLAIGPTTASAARAAGWEPAAVAGAPSAAALASAIHGLLSPR